MLKQLYMSSVPWFRVLSRIMKLLCWHAWLARNGGSDGCICGMKEKSVSLERSGWLGKKSSPKKLEGQPALEGDLFLLFCSFPLLATWDFCWIKQIQNSGKEKLDLKGVPMWGWAIAPRVSLAHSRISLRCWFRSRRGCHRAAMKCLSLGEGLALCARAVLCPLPTRP